VLAALVFVPVHYLYPSRTPFLQRTTLILGSIWGAMVVALAFYPDADWAQPLAAASLYYVVYYTVVSFIHDHRVRKRYASA